MRTKTIELYEYDELDEDAQAKARDWYRQCTAEDTFWSECVIEDAKEIAKIIGIDIDHINWSGFWSQGDGACFTGHYSYRYVKGAAKTIREHAPMDTELHRIVNRLQELQRTWFYGLQARVSHREYSCHEYSVDIDVYGGDTEAADELSELLRDYMRWIYDRLYAEFEFENSDERVSENIRINEYMFTEDGEREG